MLQKHPSIVEAYSVLGLDEGSSLEDVKSAYKQLALRTHPDKNPGKTDATTQFQRVSEAYNSLVKHLDRSSHPIRGPSHGYNPSSPFGFGGFDFCDEDEDEYFDPDDFDHLGFYMFLFEEAMRDRVTRHAKMSFRHAPSSETPEQYQERLRHSREAEIAARERREQEAAARRARAEKDRETERLAAEARQKAKAESKRAQVDAQRRKAEEATRERLRRGQTLRSSVFAAARVGDAKKVKKGVWEDGVDAAGGEVKAGCHNFMKSPPADPQETLLHIAARNGDVELVEWLDAHGADSEEHNSAGFTALHVAVQHGHGHILKHFLEAYPPKEQESKPIYHLPTSETVLSLALHSREPQVVWMVLNNGLASTQDISNAWAYISSEEGTAAMKKNFALKSTVNDAEKTDDIMKLLARFGGFTPPLTPDSSNQNGQDIRASDAQPNVQPDVQRQQKEERKQRPRPLVEQPSSQASQSNGVSESRHKSSNVNRGRGRGRGRTRGRGGGAPRATP